MGRRGFGALCVFVGLASLAIGGVLAALDLGAVYTDMAADPFGPAPDNAKQTSHDILWHVLLGAAGVPIASVGWFLLRRAKSRSR